MTSDLKDFIATFHDLVKKYFKGYLKPPFDTDGRTIAGMTEEVIQKELKIIWPNVKSTPPQK